MDWKFQADHAGGENIWTRGCSGGSESAERVMFYCSRWRWQLLTALYEVSCYSGSNIVSTRQETLKMLWNSSKLSIPRSLLRRSLWPEWEGVGSLKNIKRPPKRSRDHCIHPHHDKKPRYERCLLSRRMHRNLQKQFDHDVSMHLFRKRLESVHTKFSARYMPKRDCGWR